MPPSPIETPDHPQVAVAEGFGREGDRLIVKTVEQDRLRIAAVLHGSACQSLGALQLLAATLQRKMPAAAESSNENIHELVEVLRQVSKELREVIRWLRPPPVKEEGLIVSLIELEDEISRVIPCEFHCDDRRMKLDPYVAEQLYQIALAAALSAAQRGAATRIEITLAADTRNGLDLSIWDDANSQDGGPECEPDLCNWELLRLRARAIGGQLTVRSPDSGGTAVVCHVDAAALVRMTAPG